MTKPLRWGILGAAKFAREHMAPAMMLAKDTELAPLQHRLRIRLPHLRRFTHRCRYTVIMTLC